MYSILYMFLGLKTPFVTGQLPFYFTKLIYSIVPYSTFLFKMKDTCKSRTPGSLLAMRVPNIYGVDSVKIYGTFSMKQLTSLFSNILIKLSSLVSKIVVSKKGIFYVTLDFSTKNW